MQAGLPGAKLLLSLSAYFTEHMQNSPALGRAEDGKLRQLLGEEANRLRGCVDREARGTALDLLQRLSSTPTGKAALAKLWHVHSSSMSQVQPAARFLLRPPSAGLSSEQHAADLTRLLIIADVKAPGTHACLLSFLRAFASWAAAGAATPVEGGGSSSSSASASAFLTLSFGTDAVAPGSPEEQQAHATIRALRTLNDAQEAYVPRSRLAQGLLHLSAEELEEFKQLFRDNVSGRSLRELSKQHVPEAAYHRLEALSVKALQEALKRESAKGRPQMKRRPITPGGALHCVELG
jgi:hypothetical protein